MVSPPVQRLGRAAGAAEAPLHTQSARILRVIEVRKARHLASHGDEMTAIQQTYRMMNENKSLDEEKKSLALIMGLFELKWESSILSKGFDKSI